LKRPAIDKHLTKTVVAFDLGFVANRTERCMQIGDLGIVEQVDVGARRRADVHHVFEYQELFPGKGSRGHSKPRIAG
jgi:hypothetical protein